MLAINDPRWATLRHAYGHAADIPALLSRAGEDARPGHQAGTTWFNLWSALCHQGDAYTASYAAVPHLVRMASVCLERQQYDPLFLTACIELARLEDRGPLIPTDLAPSYRASIEEARSIAEAHLGSGWDPDSEVALRASAAALAGNASAARAMLDAEDGSAGSA